jgi:hypothetical protein
MAEIKVLNGALERNTEEGYADVDVLRGTLERETQSATALET